MKGWICCCIWILFTMTACENMEKQSPPEWQASKEAMSTTDGIEFKAWLEETRFPLDMEVPVTVHVKNKGDEAKKITVFQNPMLANLMVMPCGKQNSIHQAEISLLFLRFC